MHRRSSRRLLLGLVMLVAACAPAAAPSRMATEQQATASHALANADDPAQSLSSSAAPIHLVVNYAAAGGGQSGLWIAYEAGYYREQGLDVELVNIVGNVPAMQAMVAGQVQLGGLDPGGAIQASLSGPDLVMLFAGVNRLPYAVMTQPIIQEPSALRGKTIGITRLGSSSHTAARLALEKWGLVPDVDVALRQLGDPPGILAGMQAGQIDAGLISPPTTTLAREAGYHQLFDLAVEGPEYPSITVGGLRPWIQANDEAVRRFGRAYVQAMQRLKTDKPWMLELYRKYLRLDDPQLLEDTYNQYRNLFPTIPYVSESGVARLLEDLAVEEPRLAGRQASDWIDSHYVRDMEASGFVRQVVGDGPGSIGSN